LEYFVHITKIANIPSRKLLLLSWIPAVKPLIFNQNRHHPYQHH
jgi:hypothetical protein